MIVVVVVATVQKGRVKLQKAGLQGRASTAVLGFLGGRHRHGCTSTTSTTTRSRRHHEGTESFATATPRIQEHRTRAVVAMTLLLLLLLLSCHGTFQRRRRVVVVIVFLIPIVMTAAVGTQKGLFQDGIQGQQVGSSTVVFVVIVIAFLEGRLASALVIIVVSITTTQGHDFVLLLLRVTRPIAMTIASGIGIASPPSGQDGGWRLGTIGNVGHVLGHQSNNDWFVIVVIILIVVIQKGLQGRQQNVVGRSIAAVGVIAVVAKVVLGIVLFGRNRRSTGRGFGTGGHQSWNVVGVVGLDRGC